MLGVYRQPKLPTAGELTQLSREELVALVLVLVEEVQALRAEVERLERPATDLAQFVATAVARLERQSTSAVGQPIGCEAGARQDGTAVGRTSGLPP